MSSTPSSPRTRAGSALALLAVSALSTVFGACARSDARPKLPDGTAQMAERLRALNAASDPLKNLFLSSQRAQLFAADAAKETDPGRRFAGLWRAALEQTNAGEPAQALAILADLRQRVQTENLRLDDASQAAIRMCESTAYLRLGEQNNCCASGSPDACLVPIRGGGIHTDPRGSRGAITVLEESLTAKPDDLTSLWLLNIAYMTLGEYPASVPEKWRIPESAFASDYDIKRFPNIAKSVGLDVMGLAGGSITEDFDRDGFIDVMASSWGPADQLRYFRNKGDGSFEERTQQAGLIGELGGLNICQADYDNDGWTDVLVLRGAWMRDQGHYPDSLLRNNGDGTFSDVTEAAGLLAFHPGQAGVWSDFDGDGWLDLFIGNEHAQTDPNPCFLYHNEQNGKFSECAVASGITERGYVKGASWGDYDNDGRPDLYISRLGMENLLYHNDGPASGAAAGAPFRWKFHEVGKSAGVTLPIVSFACWFFDYDNDGWLDLFAMTYDVNEPDGDLAALALGRKGWCETARLYRNQHDGSFEDVTVAARVDKIRLGMGANFGDLDNDGFLDFYVGTGDPDLLSLMPNRMLRNNGGKFFQDVTSSGNFGHLQKGHGISFADLDDDGDQDLFVVMGGAVEGDKFQRLLFLNPGHGNHWITLRCAGVRSNRSAFGARIAVNVRTETGPRTIRVEGGTGGSFGASSLQQEIGLGDALAIENVAITWPASGRTDTYKDVALDRIYALNEGDAQLTPVAAKPIDLARFAPK